MRPSPLPRWEQEPTLVGQITAGISLLTLLVYLRHHDLLLYGDAVAHINIARRVLDSRTPGLLQLGTVWLPLPHIFMIPFVYSDAAWRTGIGGALPSMVGYVLGTIGIFRLVRGALSSFESGDSSTRIAAWLAAAIYAANPNLMYMQSTAMTESLYMAWFVWVLVHFSEFVHNIGTGAEDGSRSLIKCGVCLAGASLTRYDGWFLTGVLCIVVVAVVAKYWRDNPPLRLAFAKFVLIAVAAPLFWLTYNAIVYRNPLEFANGPYSAKAIEQRVANLTVPSYPGLHDPLVAFAYFFKAAQQMLGEGNWRKAWVVLLLGGTLLILWREPRRWPVLLVWIPLPFYVLSIAYGSVPVYLPEWWPHAYYNVRFGLQFLPSFAVFTAVTAHVVLNLVSDRRAKAAALAGFLLLVLGSYAFVWRAQPICVREAWANGQTRIGLETEVARTLQLLPHDSTLLMYLGGHVGALQDAGLPLHRTINEGNHRPWIKPADPEGLWERALANPKLYADYVVAFDDDAVSRSVNRENLTSMVVIRTGGQPPATIYWTHRDER
jgi:hypothetical protein